MICFTLSLIVKIPHIFFRWGSEAVIVSETGRMEQFSNYLLPYLSIIPCILKYFVVHTCIAPGSTSELKKQS